MNVFEILKQLNLCRICAQWCHLDVKYNSIYVTSMILVLLGIEFWIVILNAYFYLYTAVWFWEQFLNNIVPVAYLLKNDGRDIRSSFLLLLSLFSKEILIQTGNILKLNLKIPQHLPFKYLSGSFLVNHIIAKFSCEFWVSLFKIVAYDQCNWFSGNKSWSHFLSSLHTWNTLN